MTFNNYPALEEKYGETADISMRLEMDMIYAIENRIIQRSKHYIKDFKLKSKNEVKDD